MQHLIEESVRAVGWATLKTITAGRYKSSAGTELLLEGGIGLLVIAAGMWLAYRWFPAPVGTG
jgi:hypothetical protein